MSDEDDTAPMEETLPDGTFKVHPAPAHHRAGHDSTLDEKPNDDEHVIEARDVEVRFGSFTVFKNLNLDVRRGEILGFVGGSGQGKSVLMRTILDLVPKCSGTIRLFDKDVDALSASQRSLLNRRYGVLFQMGALFSSLTVKENIQVPMKEQGGTMSKQLMDELALMKIDMVGLARNSADKLPSELSGGMIKRAGLARALALDPDLLFVDEPTSGLDPIGAANFDDLIAGLRDTLGLTVYMVTHDLDSLWNVCDRVAVLADKRVIVNGPVQDLVDYDHPWVQEYFRGVRGGRFVST
ncbi:ABC transporter ATP-binding protein [Acuticoccus sp. I52.16.1]|uniref:ABC transporter ATP-binding protein n=1 Tax=Acuticoccus sp. I52.16.1 TaxID=2928472 RepID=UPI001FD162CD|nr:ABC transporter ATP-binding protein [Acuticoccus sp. I52.16.1]UOM34722.1 ABC transporter ATP-binding protein [Acuticoccus sp. I52.16.1]